MRDKKDYEKFKELTKPKYLMRCFCTNCMRSEHVSFEKGIKATTRKCPNCGCYTLEPRESSV